VYTDRQTNMKAQAICVGCGTNSSTSLDREIKVWLAVVQGQSKGRGHRLLSWWLPLTKSAVKNRREQESISMKMAIATQATAESWLLTCTTQKLCLLVLCPVEASMPDVKHRWLLFCEVGATARDYSSLHGLYAISATEALGLSVHNTSEALELVCTPSWPYCDGEHSSYQWPVSRPRSNRPH